MTWRGFLGSLVVGLLGAVIAEIIGLGLMFWLAGTRWSHNRAEIILVLHVAVIAVAFVFVTALRTRGANIVIDDLKDELGLQKKFRLAFLTNQDVERVLRQMDEQIIAARRARDESLSNVPALRSRPGVTEEEVKRGLEEYNIRHHEHRLNIERLERERNARIQIARKLGYKPFQTKS